MLVQIKYITTNTKNTQQNIQFCTCEGAVHVVFGEDKAHQQGIERNSLLIGICVAHRIGVAIEIQPRHACVSKEIDIQKVKTINKNRQ